MKIQKKKKKKKKPGTVKLGYLVSSHLFKVKVRVGLWNTDTVTEATFQGSGRTPLRVRMKEVISPIELAKGTKKVFTAPSTKTFPRVKGAVIPRVPFRTTETKLRVPARGIEEVVIVSMVGGIATEERKRKEKKSKERT